MSSVSSCCRHRRGVLGRLLVTGLCVALLSICLHTGRATWAGDKRGKGSKGKARAAAASTWLFRTSTNVVPNQRGKIVVFTFRNDDGDGVSTQVRQLLEARGLDVMTGVRPVDSAEQYRDVATTLGLVGFVDGDVRGNDKKVRVTIRLRNGYTGRQAAQATFTESRSNLAGELSSKLWTKLGAATARACVDGDKPRKMSRTTIKINAGTPIETVPAKVSEENN